MSTVANPTVAKNPPTARPPTNLNPTAQPGPKAPPTSVGPTTASPKAAPAATESPDISKASVSPVDPVQGIKALFADKAEAKPTAAEPAKPDAKPDATAATPDKKPETPIKTDSFVDMAPPENLSEKGKEGWETFKSKAKSEVEAARKALADAQAELGTLKKATPAEVAEVERLRAEHKEAMDKLAVLSLENHPDFVRQYNEPKRKALAEAATLLTDNGITDAVDFNALLAKPRAEFAKAVTELTGKMVDFDKASFATAMREAYKLTAESRDALSKAGELKAGIEAKTAAQQKQAFEETWGKFGGAENFLKPAEITESMSPEERNELSAYNESIRSVRTEAEKNAFGRVDPKTASVIASKAAVLDFVVSKAIPRMEKEVSRLVSDNQRLASELQAIKAAKSHGGFEGTPGATNQPAANTPWQQGLRGLYKK